MNNEQVVKTVLFVLFVIGGFELIWFNPTTETAEYRDLVSVHQDRKSIQNNDTLPLEHPIENEDCDWHCYLHKYPELLEAFGPQNIKRAKTHWKDRGKQEERDCTCECNTSEDCPVEHDQRTCNRGVCYDCSVDGNAGNGTAQGTCPNGLLCYADGTCHGTS